MAVPNQQEELQNVIAGADQHAYFQAPDSYVGMAKGIDIAKNLFTQKACAAGDAPVSHPDDYMTVPSTLLAMDIHEASMRPAGLPLAA